MRVSVRLFAVLRERTGRERLELELPEGATVAEAKLALSAEPGLGEALDRLAVAIAVNRDYADDATALAPGDELALVPPVSGGAADREPEPPVHVRIAEGPLSAEELSRIVRRPAAGAVVLFEGITREVERLDYEAYGEMASERIETILRECAARHGLEAAAAEHRVGSVPLGEASVVVAVSAAHRDEAFAGARAAIDRIKAEAPIWKREVEAGEARWVEGTPVGGAETGAAGERAPR